MSKEHTYKDFDLPTKFSEGEHHVTPKSRDPEVIAFRRSRPSGTALAYSVRDGLEVATEVLRQTANTTSIGYAREIVAASLLGSSWHEFGENAEVMRRRLKLHQIVRPEGIERPDAAQVTEEAIAFLEDTIPHADQIALCVERGFTKNLEVRRQHFGRRLGNGALILAAADVANIAHDNPGLSDAQTQAMVRNRSLGLLAHSRELGTKIGRTLSLAQFVTVGSPLYVEAYNEAPDDFHRPYVSALAEIPA